jgi:Papain family cysteine protease
MRANGYLRDAPDARDWSVYRLSSVNPMTGARSAPGVGSLAVADIPASVNLCGYVDKVRDQGPASTCVAQTFARMLHVRAQVAAAKAGQPFPSAQALYQLTLATQIGDPHAPLADIGCYPRMAAKVLSDVGWCDEDRYPYDVATITDRPGWDVVQAGSDRRTTDYYRIDADPATRADDVRRALAFGFPVGIGVPDGPQFQNYAGGIVLPEPNEHVTGLHMLPILGFLTDMAGVRTYLGVNSWGTSWGQAGFFEASEAWVNDARVTDVYVLSGWKS